MLSVSFPGFENIYKSASMRNNHVSSENLMIHSVLFENAKYLTFGLSMLFYSKSFKNKHSLLLGQNQFSKESP